MTTNYYNDLEDVIQWAGDQQWYQEPFLLVGQSIGGLCVCLYAERYPKKVLGLVPISTVVSGQLTVEAHKQFDPEEFATWEKTGWHEYVSISKRMVVRIPWSHILDRLQYDLLPHVSALTMPALLIVGEDDTSTPPNHIQQLYDALPGPKELHIIPGAPHTLRDPVHLAELKNLLLTWIDSWLV